MVMKARLRDQESMRGLRDLCFYMFGRWREGRGSQASCVEIGSYVGASSIVLAQFFDQLYCVDPWAGGKGLTAEIPWSQIEREFDTVAWAFPFVIKKMKMTGVGTFTPTDSAPHTKTRKPRPT